MRPVNFKSSNDEDYSEGWFMGLFRIHGGRLLAFIEDKNGNIKSCETSHVEFTDRRKEVLKKPKKLTQNQLYKQNEKRAIFDECFWSVYPKRNGKKLGRDKAEKAFIKFPSKKIQEIVSALSNYIDSGTMPKDAFRWLGDGPGCWIEWTVPAEQEGNIKDQPKQPTTESLL